MNITKEAWKQRVRDLTACQTLPEARLDEMYQLNFSEEHAASLLMLFMNSHKLKPYLNNKTERIEREKV